MNTHLKVRVDPDAFGLPGNRHHCAIANAIMLAEPDVVLVRVDEFNIRFSRRSTGTRFEFITPANAADFIHEFDKLIAEPQLPGGKVRKMTAKPFTLHLTDHHLLREVPRRARSASYAIKRAAVKAYGPTVVEPPTKPSPTAKASMGRAEAAAAKPVARKRSNPAPRRRPSQRVAS